MQGEEEVFVNGQPQEAMRRFIRSQPLLPCLFSWIARKPICSESTFAGKYAARQTSSHRYS